jgi:Putative MetA-pathway of phenol degradation
MAIPAHLALLFLFGVNSQGQDTTIPPPSRSRPPIAPDFLEPPPDDPGSFREAIEELHEDPYEGTTVPITARDRFLFPSLVNFFDEDQWRGADDAPIAEQRRINRRARVDIREPGPDLANFPNGPFTVPQGRLFIENYPLSLTGPGTNVPAGYAWEFLTRYGLTDNLELRLFSSGYTKTFGRNGTTGFSPLAFDLKVHLWEENRWFFLPAAGLEIFLQTDFGSPAFNQGVQPSINLLFDHTLPCDIGFEWNVGVTGNEGLNGESFYAASFQFAFQRAIVDDFDVFIHGYLNDANLPRVFATKNDPNEDIFVIGAGAIWTVNDRLSIFGSYNAGVLEAPTTLAFIGFAVAF